jgi:AcrR family transcriptional regulator
MASVTAIKRAIFMTAQKLFAQHGFAGVSIADIAGGASTAKSTVLHHFPTKLALYQAVMKQSLEQFSAVATSQATSETSAQQLGTGLKNLLHWMVNEPVHAKLLNHIFMDNPKAAELAAKKYWLPLMKSLLAGSSPESKKAESHLRLFILFIVNSIIQMAFSIELQVLLLNEPIERHELLRRYENLITELIKNQKFSG